MNITNDENFSKIPKSDFGKTMISQPKNCWSFVLLGKMNTKLTLESVNRVPSKNPDFGILSPS